MKLLRNMHYVCISVYMRALYSWKQCGVTVSDVVSLCLTLSDDDKDVS